MIEVIVLAIIVAKIKKMDLTPLITTKVFYPIYAFEAVVMVFQILIFFGIYTFVPYAKYIKTLYMLALAVPLVLYRQWVYCIISSVCVFIGSTMNNFVMAVNSNKMPVYPSLSYITGYVKSNNLDIGGGIHVLGNEITKYKFLTDYIDIGYSILSVGDLFIRVMAFLAIYGTIKHFNNTAAPKKGKQVYDNNITV